MSDKEKQDDQQSDPNIHVDEDWKESARREKEVDSQLSEEEEKPKAAPGPIPEPSLTELIKGFAIQALIGLGEADNPLTGKREKNLDWAKYNIDMLQILEDKTKSNLEVQEKNMLVQFLYDLRMRYVKAVS